MILTDVLKENGPLTGKEIIEKTGVDIFELWKACKQSGDILIHTIGTRYLRLDKNVEGFARLSPSVFRELSNYSVIAWYEQEQAAHEKAERLHQEIIEISRNKSDLARKIMEDVFSIQYHAEEVREKACCILAGDVAYQMAHREARPEFSTGKLVNGSDLDIVIVHDGLTEGAVKNLDSAVYNKKCTYLFNPAFREELDYIIKDITKVEKQLAFDCFESMVASKILDEGKFLCGNHELFFRIKSMLAEKEIPWKLEAMRQRAFEEREKAKRQLLALDVNEIQDPELAQLFYTTSEREEFF